MSSISIMYSLSCYKYIVRKEGVTVSTPVLAKSSLSLFLSVFRSTEGDGWMGATMVGRPLMVVLGSYAHRARPCLSVKRGRGSFVVSRE
jgi:hypothetical protein